jgi:hypothetical protein
MQARIKRIAMGDKVSVSADIFADCQDVLQGGLRFRHEKEAAWRKTQYEITQYFQERTQSPVHDFFRPNLWPDTPDILTEFLPSDSTGACVGDSSQAADRETIRLPYVKKRHNPGDAKT